MPFTEAELEAVEQRAAAAAVKAVKEYVDQAVDAAAEKAAQKVALTQSGTQALVESTVKTTLVNLGITALNPEETQEDFRTLRRWRKARDDVQMHGTRAAITTFLAGVIALLLLGLQRWFGK